MKTIFLSPERRPNPHGKYAVGDTYEHDVMTELAEKLKPLLDECGFSSTIANESETIYQRAKTANAANFDLYIALHSNGSTNDGSEGTAQGPECLYYGNKLGSSYKANEAVLNRINEIYPYTTRGLIREDSFIENKNTNMTSVYIELAFHDNSKDAQWILDNLDAIADKIRLGVCDYYQVKVKETASSTTLEKKVALLEQNNADLIKKNTELTKKYNSLVSAIQGIMNEL